MSAVLVLAGVLLACAACGSGDPTPMPTPSAPVVTSTVPADPCAPPAPPQQPALHVCLSGAITGSALVPSREATSCTGQLPGSLSGTFVTLVNSIETRLDLTDGQGVGTFDLASADVTVTVIQAGTKSWSSIGGGSPSGTVVVAADRSGSLDVTLAPRNLASGGAVPGGSPLRVRGTFRCPA